MEVMPHRKQNSFGGLNLEKGVQRASKERDECGEKGGTGGQVGASAEIRSGDWLQESRVRFVLSNNFLHNIT